MSGSKYELQRAVGQRVKTARMQRGYSQALLAEKTELSEGHIIQIEGGFKSLSVQSLCKVAEALQVSADSLLFGRTKRGSYESIEMLLSTVSDADLVKIEELVYFVIKSFLTEG